MKNSRLATVLDWRIQRVAFGSVLVIIMLVFSATNGSLKAQQQAEHASKGAGQEPHYDTRNRMPGSESARIDALLEKMRRLEERLDALEKKLDDLQSRVGEVSPKVEPASPNPH